MQEYLLTVWYFWKWLFLLGFSWAWFIFKFLLSEFSFDISSLGIVAFVLYFTDQTQYKGNYKIIIKKSFREGEDQELEQATYENLREYKYSQKVNKRLNLKFTNEQDGLK